MTISPRKPALSVVVVVHDMGREARRTLYSLSAEYQRFIGADEYEVIVVDNASDVPVEPAAVDGLNGDFRVVRLDAASPSPARAINRGLAEARSDIVAVMTDGARIATPGLLHFARHGAQLYDNAVVATLGWYLGYDLQGWALKTGYDRAREDALLSSIDWPSDGYRLFDIGTMDESSSDGWFRPIGESSALVLRREMWESLGGADERFDVTDGGLINADTFRRALGLPGAELVILLGEGTFRQLHGGTGTNSAPDVIPRPQRPPTYVGTLPKPVLARMIRAATHPVERHFEPPLGPEFNQALWTAVIPPRCADERFAAVLDRARHEFHQGHLEASCALARLLRARVPDEPGPERLLSLVAHSVQSERFTDSVAVEYHLALAEAHRILDEPATAETHYRNALAFNPDLPQAHLGLAALRMPGDDYLAWLDRLYRWLAPETAIEVGVSQGTSLALLQPPTMAIGVDPFPSVASPLKTETHIFAETSDEFFAQCHAQKLLEGRLLSVAFIDGLHLFEQAVRDFIGLEALCGPGSVIFMHDTVPLDGPTQSRERQRKFYTGDVWKAVLLLKEYRPDLEIFTIATPPSGLTVVTGLDPASRVLSDRYDEAVARYLDMPFETIEADMGPALNIVANDANEVRSRLEQRHIMTPASVVDKARAARE
jgi:hypothetical protein